MSKKLLLADDSVTIQKVIGISFANEDVTLVTVDNGDDAIAKTRELRPDLVLADVVMPGKTGYEVCESIKADPNLRHIPVLLLTGTFEAFDEDRARQVGAAGHVAKPFEAQTLVDQVNQLLAASSAPPAEIEPATSVVAEAADESFDFFSEEASSAEAVAETVVEPIQTEVGGAASVEAREELEIGSSLDLETDLAGQDDAFSFSDEAFQELIAVPVPAAGQAAAAESTVAILPDSDDLEGAPAFATELVESEPAEPGEDLFSIDAAPLGPREGAEREPQGETALFGDDLSLSTDTIDLAQATVLDPGSASGFDVSSSEFDDSFSGQQAAAPAMPIDVAVPTEALRPASSGEPAAATHISDASRAAVDAVVPKLREQLHDTLEKVAWESFGSITEEIVRQAVDRVEAVAWEVIPQLAETLIHEEIRKMKGEE